MRNLRLTSQFLSGTVRPDIATVIARMAALQAQDYYGSLWSVGIRTGLPESAVIAALEARQLVRTWPQRGTLHLVASQDATWMTQLSAERQLRMATHRHENLRLDVATFQRADALFAQALQGGATLSRPEMLALLEQHGISTQAGRGYHMLWAAAQRSLIYVGPMRQKQQTFGLVADLPGTQRHLGRPEAVAELARRYFCGRGPATIKDFMWWAGLTSAEARAAIADNVATLRSVVFEDTTYWLSNTVEPTDTLPTILLLPGFDEFLLGYSDRSLQMRQEHRQAVVPGSNGMFMPTVVLNGEVTGIWKRQLKSTKQPTVAVTFEYFATLPARAQAQVTRCVAEYGTFVGMPANIVAS